MYTAYVDGELLYSPMLAHDGYAILDPVLTMELNKVPTFKFSLPPTNERYLDIKRLTSIVTVKDGEDVIFRGRVLDDKGDFYKTRAIYCEGDLGFLLDTVVEPYKYPATPSGTSTLAGLFTELITAHNARTDAYKRFVIGDVTVKAGIESGDKTTEILRKGSEGESVKRMQLGLISLGYALTQYGADGKFGDETETQVKAFQTDQGLDADGIYGPKTHNAMIKALNDIGQTTDVMSAAVSECLTTLEEIQKRMIDVYGGYLSTRHVYENGTLVTYIDYLNESGEINPETIEFGKNLLDLSKYVNAKDVYTVLLPEGKQREKPVDGEINRTRVTSVNDGSPYVESITGIAMFGRVEKHQVWDDIDSPETLFETAKEELAKNVEESLTLEITAAVLHMLNINTNRLILGGYNHMVSIPHGLDVYLQCSRITAYLVNPEKTAFIFGNVPSRMTNIQSKIIRQEKFASRESMLSLMNRVTALETPT